MLHQAIVLFWGTKFQGDSIFTSQITGYQGYKTPFCGPVNTYNFSLGWYSVHMFEYVAVLVL